MGFTDSREFSTDVVVVGSGASGSGAALAALAAGATVTLLEKRPVGGGSAALSAGGFWTFEDRTKFDELARLGNREMQYKLHAHHHVAADFIRSLGVTIADRPIRSGNRFGVGYKLDITGLLAYAQEAVVEAGGQVLLETAAVGLVQERDRVAGVLARSADGTLTTIRAKSVVLASGGFQGNREMLARYMGQNADHLLVRSNPGSVGDGFRLAQSAGGAGTKGMSTFYGHLIAHPVTSFEPEEFRPLTQYHSAASVLVGMDGERLADERVGDSVLSQVVLRAPGARGVLIFDDHVRRNEGTDEPFPGVGRVDRFERARSAGARTATADTLDAIIDQVAEWGVARDALRLTMQAYVAAVSSSSAQALGVPVAPDARAPQTAPFYAVEVQPAITFTFGGVRVSLDGEVLDPDGRPVPGLFAGGADVGGISHWAYAGGLAPCFITGMWAGKAAAHAHAIAERA
ncbi:FAD-dependent oxidoreductase [Streptomyces sp. ITFR-6]|uniref:FAD-dependent oxidoreductase n=1 Tax=Streptomyces sp. ITFR-6 TaxID=3075197 RepID=UPI00288BAE86|nr:FAD-dependent oxidoreductase [Streptomyces sp. ITFR-6]WNI28248.1 FAD-dependent oxidoreductase [Streptomyces sp. ITFR-6]